MRGEGVGGGGGCGGGAAAGGRFRLLGGCGAGQSGDGVFPGGIVVRGLEQRAVALLGGPFVAGDGHVRAVGSFAGHLGLEGRVDVAHGAVRVDDQVGARVAQRGPSDARAVVCDGVAFADDDEMVDRPFDIGGLDRAEAQYADGRVRLDGNDAVGVHAVDVEHAQRSRHDDRGPKRRQRQAAGIGVFAIAIAERYGAVGKVRDQGKRRARERGSRGVAVDEEALAIYVQRYLVGLA